MKILELIRCKNKTQLIVRKLYKLQFINKRGYLRDDDSAVVAGAGNVSAAGARQGGIDVTSTVGDDGVGRDSAVIRADLEISASGSDLALGIEEVLDNTARAGVCRNNGVSWSVEHVTLMCLMSSPCTIWNS